jgi:hypothetical protein
MFLHALAVTVPLPPEQKHVGSGVSESMLEETKPLDAQRFAHRSALYESGTFSFELHAGTDAATARRKKTWVRRLFTSISAHISPRRRGCHGHYVGP